MLVFKRSRSRAYAFFSRLKLMKHTSGEGTLSTKTGWYVPFPFPLKITNRNFVLESVSFGKKARHLLWWCIAYKYWSKILYTIAVKICALIKRSWNLVQSIRASSLKYSSFRPCSDIYFKSPWRLKKLLQYSCLLNRDLWIKFLFRGSGLYQTVVVLVACCFDFVDLLKQGFYSGCSWAQILRNDLEPFEQRSFRSD